MEDIWAVSKTEGGVRAGAEGRRQARQREEEGGELRSRCYVNRRVGVLSPGWG